MTEALIYTRVSQDRAGGRSVAEQETEAREVCVREGWNVADVVTDSVGASRHSKGRRTGWKHAQELLERGDVDVLVTWEASRAQRDLAAYSQLRDLCAKHGVLWSYSGRTHDMAAADDRFRTGLDALMAEREAEETAGRVQRALRSNAQKGRPHGRRLYGYRRVYDQATGALVGQEPDPAEAAVVQSMFCDYLTGIGVRTIAARITADGTTTGTGAAWTDMQVRRVIKNPAYAARRVHRGDVIGAADWPALVDAETFDRAQARLAAMMQGKSRQRGTARLLTGVGRCGVCGGRIHALHDRRGRKFYECQAGYCVARDLTKLDAYVTAVVLGRLARPDVAEALADSEPPALVVEARAEVDDLRARLDAAVAEFTAGNLSASTLAKIEADLVPRITEAERAARRALVPIEIEVPASNVDEWWGALSAEQHREIVGALIAALVVLPVGKGSRTFDPAGVRVEWCA